MTQLYGPAVCCKPNVMDRDDGLALLYPAREWSVHAPGHHGYPHASDLIRVKALRGRTCHQIADATVGPFLHPLNPRCNKRDRSGSRREGERSPNSQVRR